MLGPGPFSTARRLAGSSRQDLDVCATRVWSAIECLRKVGTAGEISLQVDDPPDGNWITLSCGTVRIATVTARVPGAEGVVVVAACTRPAYDSSDR